VCWLGPLPFLLVTRRTMGRALKGPFGPEESYPPAERPASSVRALAILEVSDGGDGERAQRAVRGHATKLAHKRSNSFEARVSIPKGPLPTGPGPVPYSVARAGALSWRCSRRLPVEDFRTGDGDVSSPAA
jgi:hypothetical protein